MVCHALGRCRICAKKHKLPIFGSEESQHALIERVHLQLIVLNTVCIDCLAKFEQLVKKVDFGAHIARSDLQRETTECCRPFNDTAPTAVYARTEARPSMQFYVETEREISRMVPESYENERLIARENFEAVQAKTTHRTSNRHISNVAKIKLRNVAADAPKRATKIRATRKGVQCHLCCNFCEKEFTHSGDLKRHKRKHTGEKPYECPECQKTFSQLSNLTRHRLVHSGERPFACADCGQSYSRKGRLANHIGRELCRRKRPIPVRLPPTLKE